MTFGGIMVTVYQSFVVVWNCPSKFVFIDRRSSNSECPDSHRAVTGINIWLARLNVHWHKLISFPIVIKVCRNFKEGLHFIAKNLIFFRNSAFSNTEVSLLIDHMAEWNLFDVVNSFILKFPADVLKFPTIVFSF